MYRALGEAKMGDISPLFTLVFTFYKFLPKCILKTKIEMICTTFLTLLAQHVIFIKKYLSMIKSEAIYNSFRIMIDV